MTLDDVKYTAVSDVNAGYDAAMMMHKWGESEWYWWAFQVKRVGMQGKITEALSKWDDDNATGTVGRALNDMAAEARRLDLE